MKTMRIHSVGVEYPTNTTTVTLDIVETSGKITKTLESLTLNLEGIFPNMTNELFDLVLATLKEGGYDLMTTQMAE